jgi:predicted protein tyrosine phosphatase
VEVPRRRRSAAGLSEIADVVVTDGLEWLDAQVMEVRRHHEKLEKRRQSEKERASKD